MQAGAYPDLMGLILLLLSCTIVEGVGSWRASGPDELELVGSCATKADAVPLYEDADGDGYGNDLIVRQGCLPADGWAERAGDCDDAEPSIHEGQPEQCNGVDDDCDFSVDEAPDRLFCPDKDEDGFGDVDEGIHVCEAPSRHVEDCSDCDDDDEMIHPDAVEVAGDGIDNDCDEVVD